MYLPKFSVCKITFISLASNAYINNSKIRYGHFPLLFSHQVVSNSLWPHEPQHTRLPCLTPSPGVCPNDVHWIGEAIQLSHPLTFSIKHDKTKQNRKYSTLCFCEFNIFRFHIEVKSQSIFLFLLHVLSSRVSVRLSWLGRVGRIEMFYGWGSRG